MTATPRKSRTDSAASQRHNNDRIRVLLVGVTDLSATISATDDTHVEEEYLNELRELMETLETEVVGQCAVKIREPQIRYLIGSGKAEELVATAKSLKADWIVFDDPLTPSQQRNWEQLAGCDVLDREEVILEIFARRAQTKEAVLQVELARSQYHLPRLKRLWSHLGRQRGMAGGTGGRGEGEQQIELDYRTVRRRITRLKSELKEVRQHRHVARQRRVKSSIPMVAIVGYTNAGKSSLLNALTQAGVLVEDKLFATLDPTLRRLTLPNRQELLLSDTVGFIRKLPHSLVEAFKSTLEVAADADLIIELLDVSSPLVELHQTTTTAVLTELGAERQPMLTVFNKTDAVTDAFTIPALRRRFPDAEFISAKTGEGLDRLLERLSQLQECRMRRLKLLLPHARSDLMARLHRCAHILHQEYGDDGIAVEASIPLASLPVFEPFIA